MTFSSSSELANVLLGCARYCGRIVERHGQRGLGQDSEGSLTSKTEYGFTVVDVAPALCCGLAELQPPRRWPHPRRFQPPRRHMPGAADDDELLDWKATAHPVGRLRRPPRTPQLAA